MRLKNEIEYVFRILNYLSLQDKNRIVTSNEIAEKENIPHLFSIRVLKKMEKKGLLKIYKGAAGGYKLNKKPEDITLKDAVEAIESEIIIKDKSCVVGQTSCSVIFNVLEKVENNFLNNLQKFNFKDLTSQDKDIMEINFQDKI
ncbi:MAG: Rrf2 family transcriptional regulator [Fusobacterium sp.]|uniref:Rrf2 family transcriptional regulator n=1 Tax=Fusobacterium sp. TaxID=68766 RepID=UPI0026DD0D8E|nr:Rrf2 family transcriptional regulator [Fusobacterium sp.]MDO4690303.1 Rrf2 family transcriptional regulator [Fusobacterium sp.]